MLIFGGLPWQAYFQRVLSARTANNAQLQSILAGFACMSMAIPSIMIGAAAKATDWDQVFSDYSKANNLNYTMKILVSKFTIFGKIFGKFVCAPLLTRFRKLEIHIRATFGFFGVRDGFAAF